MKKIITAMTLIGSFAFAGFGSSDSPCTYTMYDQLLENKVNLSDGDEFDIDKNKEKDGLKIYRFGKDQHAEGAISTKSPSPTPIPPTPVPPTPTRAGNPVPGGNPGGGGSAVAAVASTWGRSSVTADYHLTSSNISGAMDIGNNISWLIRSMGGDAFQKGWGISPSQGGVYISSPCGAGALFNQNSTITTMCNTQVYGTCQQYSAEGKDCTIMIAGKNGRLF